MDSVLISERKCFKCENPEMEYTKCGRCDRTCDNLSPLCLDNNECVEKCQCPLHAPIYDNGKCITAEQCGDAVIVSYNDSFELPPSDEQFIEQNALNIHDNTNPN